MEHSNINAGLFGKPITNETLAAMPKFAGKEMGRQERADEAFAAMYKDHKKSKAIEFVKELKREYGDGVSTLCLIDNATGDAITCVGDHDWRGHLEKVPYPPRIGNGQWAAFLHVKNAAEARGSEGAIVYRGQNESGIKCDFMQCWYNPWDLRANRAAYSEVREENHFKEPTFWDIVYNKLTRSPLNHIDIYNGCKSSVGI
ncbi:23 kDa jasmonate-induced protein [Ziziphus jujuba]|uniref:23 kDa jasmonate-induced protein n=2 Tax=Ziziphus jujuba TaxID=326968 RepID=A0A6P3ZS35_ZIZJJ|nr:23 kDa jasmonate-induced protein [Ziziphus jujuba]KAH7529454.1 hypothetical protein FEM48_Zijuj05G0185700 [Ziziphus jujuba var. spinosa]